MLARLLRAAPLRLHSVRYCSSNNDGMLAAVIDRDRTVANVVNPYTGHSEPLYKPVSSLEL